MHSHTSNNLLSTNDISLSFAGCGFLCIYHAGVCAAIKEYAPQLARNKICGASAGSIAATFLLCDICISKATSNILQVVTQARSRALGALHPSFNLLQLVRDGLELALPDNAHELCSGKLYISLTRVKDHQNVIVSQYDTREELIQAIICSCFIPFYCGRVPPKFRGEQYVDGGISLNQPIIDDNSITISPFSGESDICPMDEDSQSFFSFDFTGTNIRFTTKNLYRITVCLIPPNTEICSRICRQGFEDALRYLSRNGFAPCSRCLSIRSNAILMETQEENEKEITFSKTKTSIQNNIQSRKRNISVRSSSARLRIESECGECNDKVDNTTVYLPEDKESQLMEYLTSFRVVKLITYFVKPSIKPFEQLITIIINVRKWISDYNLSDYFTARFSQIFDFLWNEIYKQKANYTDKMSYQVVLTGFDSKRHYVYVKEKEKQVSLSPEAIMELKLLRQCDLMKRKVLRKVSLPNENNDVLKILDDNVMSFDADVDSLSSLVKFTNEREAILTYHYKDEEDNIKVCEIFDIDHSKQHFCKNHPSRNIKGFVSGCNISNNVRNKILPNIREENRSQCDKESQNNLLLKDDIDDYYMDVDSSDSGHSVSEDITSSNITTFMLDSDTEAPIEKRIRKLGHSLNSKSVEQTLNTSLNSLSSDSETDNNDLLFHPTKNTQRYCSNYNVEQKQSDGF
ncbi:Patatin/Phospholipase A2-related domain and Acyl transferase/acyl hydrolase/lysophospholipase domain-containing protein [Strongyloides ratti]|uniref:triacylglycerol lipase n=1 Tax=Strongyloides ratti TaxID=34506 RepID=A0A090KU48_STRRB|nr:Patatin/Phospholipase A2-related domain and Acyl transferase/acyl hydrolase/lysophospholipase domain-containing protein [Strongyloides ratti]CEF59390.1 Patatin/Phospholipase A2-related domain and Acyl transferase/acyl hydrolase/lysophospholipase domain-containing protein [Strongyloides ratti]